jgi:SAM-dependent methyltransferase
MSQAQAAKTLAFASIVRERFPECPISSILVVGCGDGNEAQVLAQFFSCRVTAIDLGERFTARDGVSFQRMDARAMTFGAGTFDLVYSFHVLEHIQPPEQVVAEIRRVLKPGMPFCLGTPNRQRVLGYLGSPGTPLSLKVRWNVADWRARLAGRFRNEFGAHAGFTNRELSALASRIGPTTIVSDEFYRRIYRHHGLAIRSIVTMSLQNMVWPAVYVIGRKALN